MFKEKKFFWSLGSEFCGMDSYLSIISQCPVFYKIGITGNILS